MKKNKSTNRVFILNLNILCQQRKQNQVAEIPRVPPRTSDLLDKGPAQNTRRSDAIIGYQGPGHAWFGATARRVAASAGATTTTHWAGGEGNA